MITCTKAYRDIPFAHRQHNHDGHCALIHGHNWEFVFTFVASARDENGFVIDFGKLGWLKVWINELFDHALVLNASDPHLDHLRSILVPDFARVTILPDGSCEGLAAYLLKYVGQMVRRHTEGRVGVLEVVVREDSKNSATAR